jgi:hypothetical protein
VKTTRAKRKRSQEIASFHVGTAWEKGWDCLGVGYRQAFSATLECKIYLTNRFPKMAILRNFYDIPPYTPFSESIYIACYPPPQRKKQKPPFLHFRIRQCFSANFLFTGEKNITKAVDKGLVCGV